MDDPYASQLDATAAGPPQSTARRAICIGVSALAFIAMTGWQPGSRGDVFTPPSNAHTATAAGASSCSCLGVATETRPHDLIMQRKRFLPEKPTRPEPGCGSAHRTLVPSTEAAMLHQTLLAAMREQQGAHHAVTRTTEVFRPEWTGRIRGLGAVVHALTPLVWWASLDSNSSATATAPPYDRRHRSMRFILPLALRGFTTDGRCSERSLDCFLQPMFARPRDDAYWPADASQRGVGVGGAASLLSRASSSWRRGQRRAASEAAAVGASTRWNITTILRLRRDQTTPRRYEYTHGERDALPGQWGSRGLFWLVSHSWRLMMRPSEAVRRHLRTHLTQLRLNKDRSRPVLAVHIRRAEACAPYIVFGRKRTCDPLAAYVTPVRALASQYGYGALLLVTDCKRTCSALACPGACLALRENTGCVLAVYYWLCCRPPLACSIT